MPLPTRDVRVMPPGTALNPWEWEAFKKAWQSELSIAYDIPHSYGTTAPVLVRDYLAPRFNERPKWTARDAVNRVARAQEANIKQTTESFANDVIVELARMHAATGLGQYDIEQPTTMRADVITPVPRVVAAEGERIPSQPSTPPVNWINVAMIGIPLLRWITGR